jgi:hypothetical protein
MLDPAVRVLDRFTKRLGARNAYHDKRSDDPIDNDTEQDLNPDAPTIKHTIQRLKLDFAKDRIHHN